MAAIKDRDAQAAVAHLYREHESLKTTIEKREAALEAKAAELAARERVVQRGIENALGYSSDPAVLAWLTKAQTETAAEPDPDSPDYVAHLARKATVQANLEFLKQLQQAQERQNAARKQEEEAFKQAEVDAANKAYITEHLGDFRNPEVHARVKVLVQNHGFTVPEAHAVSLAERAALASKDIAALKEQAQAASRARIKQGGRPDVATLEPPKGLSMVDRDAWYEAHPEAKVRRLAEYRKAGSGGY